MKTGIELISQERREQIEKHKRTIADDVLWNTDYQLQDGAIKLIRGLNNSLPPDGWSTTIWKKMLQKSLKERLIIAGAMIAAEIDRLNELERVNNQIKNLGKIN